MEIRYKKILYQEMVNHFGEEHQKAEVHTSLSRYCYLWEITLDSKKYELRWLAQNVLNIYCAPKDTQHFYENFPNFKERVYMLWSEKEQKLNHCYLNKESIFYNPN